jgi:outer membrane lipoprotein-sorting protein
MSILNSKPALRWLVPAAAAAAIIGGGAAVGTFSAAAEPSLPARSAAQLLVDLQTARLDGLSGTVVQRADLGLPALPSMGGQGSADLTALISGTHTMRVWYAGPDKARVALLGTLGESDVIRNGTDVWLWNSQQTKATHSKLPATQDRHGSLPEGLPATPQEAADQALAAIDPTTSVTVGRSAKIAGRDAYELVLSPRDKSSLVGQVRVAIDATQHVPLRFKLLAKGADQAAFEVAFTQVNFDRPDSAQFTFNPPAGTAVTEESTPPAKQQQGAEQRAKGWQTVGKGWTTVLVARTPDGAASQDGKAGPAGKQAAPGGKEADQLRGLTDQLPKVSGDWGSGRLVKGKLFSVLLADDGRILAGAVSPERLYEAARNGK